MYEYLSVYINQNILGTTLTTKRTWNNFTFNAIKQNKIKIIQTEPSYICCKNYHIKWLDIIIETNEKH
jgi:hypothetical protein